MPKSFLIKKSDRRKLSTPRKINHGQDKSNISQPSQIDGSDSFMLPYSTSANNEEIFPFSARHVKTFSDSYNSTDDEGVSVSSPLATDADSNFAPSPLAKSPSLAISVYTSLSPLRMTRLNVTDSEDAQNSQNMSDIDSLIDVHSDCSNSPLSVSSLSPSSVPSKRGRSRASAFQAGITVGYTYEQFFMTDGRSCRTRLSQHAYPPPSLSPNRSSVFSPSSTSSCSAPVKENFSAVDEFALEAIDYSKKVNELSLYSSAIVPPELDLYPAKFTAVYPSVVAQARSNQRYVCPECGKHYATSSNLSRHKQTHRSLDSHQARKCPHCNKTYVSMPALSMHLLTHDLRHRCTTCGKAFSRPWLLHGHMRSHTGEKPYGCAHCGKAFADRSNLRAHMQTHSTMKQYRCGRCDKTFALKSYLNKHYESACFKDDEESHSPTEGTSL